MESSHSEQAMNYAVSTSRLVIDTPGINNRMMGLDIFQRGGSGYFVWDRFMGIRRERDPNPWRDPYSVWGTVLCASFIPK